MLAVVCPGQGAQSPGMLSPWLEDPSFAASIASSSDATGLDLARLGTEADADTLRDTAVAQPLLVATALACAQSLGLGSALKPGVVAGHSVGEFGAAVFAGVLTEADALRLVTVRARAMAQAAAAGDRTSMAAVLGGDPDEVSTALDSLGLTPANMNGGGQVVAAGAAAAIAELAANPPAKARVIELQVAGAFHTATMAPAVQVLAAAADLVAPGQPTVPLLSNADGTEVADGAQALARLVSQVASPVRWDLCQARMVDLGVTSIVEVAPGGVLAGLAKRTMPGVAAVAVKTPADIAAAQELGEQHA